jgi:hypothetical protein
VATLKERLAELVASSPGLTDREITDRLVGRAAGQQSVNQAARSLEAAGSLVRRQRSDGKIGNYSLGTHPPDTWVTVVASADMPDGLSEDDVKGAVETWLRASGWVTKVKWGHDRGIDIDAQKGTARWIIEAKGCGSRDQMRVNYFLGLLGALLQRMDDPIAKYSIALPDMRQYRGLWARLPALAKSRTKITALFVSAAGQVEEVGTGATTAV